MIQYKYSSLSGSTAKLIIYKTSKPPTKVNYVYFLFIQALSVGLAIGSIQRCGNLSDLHVSIIPSRSDPYQATIVLVTKFRGGLALHQMGSNRESLRWRYNGPSYGIPARFERSQQRTGHCSHYLLIVIKLPGVKEELQGEPVQFLQSTHPSILWAALSNFGALLVAGVVKYLVLIGTLHCCLLSDLLDLGSGSYNQLKTDIYQNVGDFFFASVGHQTIEQPDPFAFHCNCPL
ncbi:hypothetical protein PROFUN_14687 [Planoprotostelium fungivorum]|uniref:Uncharacterized protein n=1 Tax=Planoprotostelium fungivorum TaxID=1890364 RepID=A0A2P6MZ62_9EUKA|nr:hypothetical protein PROFUN_14687 [Planoprotostelium fungivorum]